MNLRKLKSFIVQNYYYSKGWGSNKKIIVIESDDWGTIRSTLKAVQNLKKQNIEFGNNPFNEFDVLESTKDFTTLYEILEKYKDINKRPPIITANTIVANPNFEKIRNDDFEKYHYEIFTDTYKSYYSKNDTMNTFHEGIKNQFLQPQFHGREHVNVGQWLRALKNREQDVHAAFDQKVFGIDFNSQYSKRANFMATYDFDSENDLIQIHQGIQDGMNIFRKIFKMESVSTIAPAVVWHNDTEKILAEENIKFLQGYIFQNIPQLAQKEYQKSRHFTGEKNQYLQRYLIRNAYFEPSTNSNIDWVDKCLSQINLAFLLRKPAIISSHRINFVGGIKEKNRDDNLKLLDRLLKTILIKWPDVEFKSTDELGDLLIEKS